MARRRLPRVFGYRGKPPETRTSDELNTSDSETLSGKFTSEEDYGLKIANVYGFTAPTASGGSTYTVTLDGVLYKVHAFLSTGTFIVTDTGSVLTYDYMIVAGAGGGGGVIGGGGGAGGLKLQASNVLSTGTYTITVGGGGSGGVGWNNSPQRGTRGGTTSAFGQSVTGGGGGGPHGGADNTTSQMSGGSGGGGANTGASGGA